MKKIYICFVAFLLAFTAVGQTFNVQVGNVVYRFPASRTGDMEFVDGNLLVVMGKSFALADVDAMSVNEVSVQDNNVVISYNGEAAMVEVSGNVAQFVDVTVKGAHVSVAQSNVDAVDGDEITYTLSGAATDGSLSPAHTNVPCSLPGLNWPTPAVRRLRLPTASASS